MATDRDNAQTDADREEQAKTLNFLRLLSEYGHHTPGCPGEFPEYWCKCGWREIEKLLNNPDGLVAHLKQTQDWDSPPHGDA